jgi:hypothetical protein
MGVILRCRIALCQCPAAELLARWQAQPELQALTPVLCHEPALLALTGEILTGGIHSSADDASSATGWRNALLNAPRPVQRRAVYPSDGEWPERSTGN